MENLFVETHTVHNTLSGVAVAQHEIAKHDILALIAESVDSAVARSMESVRSSISKSEQVRQ
jgi:hypothetical protein